MTDHYLTMNVQVPLDIIVPEHGNGLWWSVHIAITSIQPAQAHMEGGALSLALVSDEITVPMLVLLCQVQPWGPRLEHSYLCRAALPSGHCAHISLPVPFLPHR